MSFVADDHGALVLRLSVALPSEPYAKLQSVARAVAKDHRELAAKHARLHGLGRAVGTRLGAELQKLRGDVAAGLPVREVEQRLRALEAIAETLGRAKGSDATDEPEREDKQQ